MFGLFRQQREPVPDLIEVSHEGRTLAVTLRRSPTARRYSLRLRAATREAVLTMPERGSLATAKDFADRHAGWLAARLARLPAVVPLAVGATVPLRGVPHTIVHDGATRGGVRTAPGPDGRPLIVVSGQPEFAGRRILDFLRREARRDLGEATLRHAKRLGVSVSRITVKDTVSRWGSCSARGAISYSWRLILAPAPVLDYLCAHEVAHRVEMNHSPRYWKVVASLYPDLDKAEAWLKRHGSGLHLYR
jgi:hypothetical protein